MKSSDSARKALATHEFDEVRAGGVSVPAWLGASATVAARTLDVTTLRPPRMPRGMSAPGLVDGVPEAASNRPRGDDSAPSAFDEADAQGVDSSMAVDGFERPRTDTYADEIAPAIDDEALATIATAVENISELRAQLFQRAEQQVVELALLVARRVVAREVTIEPELVRDLVREGLAALGEHDRVFVRIGSGFSDVRRELVARLDGSAASCDVAVDPELPRFGCIVETELGEVDESIDTRLDLLTNAILAEDERV